MPARRKSPETPIGQRVSTWRLSRYRDRMFPRRPPESIMGGTPPRKPPPFMPINWSPFVDFVRAHQKFLIMTHVRPDGDALGSEIGLACALRQLGKAVRVVVASDLGPRYEFANTVSTPIERFNG